MSDAQPQPELDLVMAPQPLDEVVVSAKVLLSRPEVEYRLIYSARSGRRVEQRFYTDSVWPIEKMVPRIFAMMASVFGSEPWEPKKSRAVLDALQAAYGCEEPF